MRLFFSAGEASGDAYAEAVARAAGPGFELEGVGGARFRSTGAKIIADSSKWGAISIVQAWKVGVRVLMGGLAARKALRTGAPGIFVPIDFGFLNIKLARIARKAGWKVLYFIPPGSWRRDRQGADIPAISDEIVTIFPWSAEILRSMGGKVHFFGHPLLDMSPPSAEQREGIAVLPGSRKHEIDELLPVFAKALEGLPNAVFGVAPNLDPDLLRKRWLEMAPSRTGDRFERNAAEVLAKTRAAVVCSGTATLQAAIAKTPLVVVYRLTKMMAFEATLIGVRKKVKMIAIPNILLQRVAFPELVEEAASPEAIRAQLKALLAESEERKTQLAAMDELRSELGEPGCLAKTGALLREMAGLKS